MKPDLSNHVCKAITAVRTNVANLSDTAMWKIKRARFARNRQKSVRSLRDSVKGPVESKRALSLPETLTSKIRWVFKKFKISLWNKMINCAHLYPRFHFQADTDIIQKGFLGWSLRIYFAQRNIFLWWKKSYYPMHQAKIPCAIGKCHC